MTKSISGKLSGHFNNPEKFDEISIRHRKVDGMIQLAFYDKSDKTYRDDGTWIGYVELPKDEAVKLTLRLASLLLKNVTNG